MNDAWTKSKSAWTKSKSKSHGQDDNNIKKSKMGRNLTDGTTLYSVPVKNSTRTATISNEYIRVMSN